MRRLAEHRWTFFKRGDSIEELVTDKSKQYFLFSRGDGVRLRQMEDINRAFCFETDSYLAVGKWLNRTSTGCNLRGLMLK